MSQAQDALGAEFGDSRIHGMPTARDGAADSDVRVREDVWVLSQADPWHPTLLWYARAVGALKTLNGNDFADPRCWMHLAQTHGTAIARNAWPPGAIWDACEHGSWHFLSWHRAFLHHFEKVVAGAVVDLGGPSGWSLPYWNYSDSSRVRVRALPPAFRRRLLPDGSANPLRVEERGPGINRGAKIAEGGTDISTAMSETKFTTAFAPGFGGTQAPPGTHGGADAGALEILPHGAVHVLVGGTSPPGLMSLFETAGLDPIFWLHHANIDRLWAAWLRRGPRRNPRSAAWRNATWQFGSGSTTTTLATRDVLDPRRSPLSYRYDDMPAARDAADLAGADAGFAMAGADDPGADEGERPLPPELVGASATPVPIGSRVTSMGMDMGLPTGPMARHVISGDAPPDDACVYLRLENITATRLGAGTVEVHVNLPDGAMTSAFPERRAGIVPMFGVLEASRRSENHNGGGVTITFDITTVAAELAATGDWDPRHLRVTFTPMPDAMGNVTDGDVAVGRISVFYG